jgi:hypothetical protein
LPFWPEVEEHPLKVLVATVVLIAIAALGFWLLPHLG